VLTENDIKEELSYAYVHAVSSRAGFSCENVRRDRDSIDLHVRARGRLDPSSTRTSPQLALQLKAHVRDPLPEHGFDFRLTRKNYDDLRAPKPMVPRILVVFIMPNDPASWLSLSEAELLLRGCAYWCSLLGLPDSQHEKYQEVRIERKNVFHGESLHALMLKASREEEISHGT
jgi:hypothetical protein